MNESIAKSLKLALDGHNSHLSAPVVLEGLTVDIAGKQIENAPYTIWQQICHIQFWQERFIAHLKGESLPRVLKAADGWAETTSPSDEAELNEVIQKLLTGIKEVKQLINNIETLKHPSNYDSSYNVITSLITHLSYHLGEIMALRRILGDYPPPSGAYAW